MRIDDTSQRDGFNLVLLRFLGKLLVDLFFRLQPMTEASAV